MAYKQKTDPHVGHCAATVMHSKPWNKMRNRTAAAAGKGTGNNQSLAKAEEKRSPLNKQKGGGTRKVCLPKAKIASMSKSERQAVISAKQSAASKGKYKRSSKSNVSGTASKNLKDWVKQDWRQVGDPSKKCGEK